MTRRIGAISDIHGDASALSAVFRWLDEQGISECVCAGDIAGFGPRPNECISMLAERRVQTVMGNGDAGLLRRTQGSNGVSSQDVRARLSQRESEIAEVEAWVQSRLTEQSVTYLASLAEHMEVEDGILVVHAVPGNLSGIAGPNDRPPIPDGFALVLAGHLHVPFVTHSERGSWVNVGSAGRPCDGDPRPAVTVLTESGSQADPRWQISQHRVDFDPCISARDILESGMPFAGNVAAAVLGARWYRSS